MEHKKELFTPAVKGIVAAFGGDIILKLLGIAATFITLQALDPMQYGMWQLLLSIAAGFGIVTFPGIASMLVAEISREYGAGRKREGNGIAIRAASMFITLSACGALAMVFAAPYIKQVSGIHFVELTRILAISVLVIGVRQSFSMALNSRLLFLHVQAMRIIDRLSYFIWIFIFLFLLDKGVDGVVYAYVLSNLTAVTLFTPYMFGLFREMHAQRSAEDWPVLVRSAKEKGTWVIGTDIVGTISGSLWPWIVGYFLGIETLGIISIAVLLLGQVASFVPISYVLRSILPRTAESPERMREWLVRSMKFSLWGHIVSGILAFAACVVLFPRWFPQHVAMLPLFAVLLLSLPLRGLTTSATEWFYATGSQQTLFFVSAVPKLVMLTLLPLFLLGFGLWGYIAWYIVSTDLALLARLRIIQQRLHSRFVLRDMLWFDRVDADLMTRLSTLVRGKITARFSR